jgi:hypothetical protein
MLLPSAARGQAGDPTVELGRLVAQGFHFDQPVVWLGPAAPAALENSALAEAVLLSRAVRWPEGLQTLEDFINAHPDSPWVPSLRSQLANSYHKLGRDTVALKHWEAVWATVGRLPGGPGKEIADYTFAHWTRLLASLGRIENLIVLAKENEGRVLDYGPLSQKWARTREAITQMLQSPGMSYQCGTFALELVARQLGINHDSLALGTIPSPASGFSMRNLADFSQQFGLGLVPVLRGQGAPIPVPAVIHWQQNHYAAILWQDGVYYKVSDPTFGEPRYMTRETIDAEASGAFMVPANAVPPNYRLLTQAETAQIFGRGNPNFLPDKDDQACPGDTCHDCPPPFLRLHQLLLPHATRLPRGLYHHLSIRGLRPGQHQRPPEVCH